MSRFRFASWRSQARPGRPAGRPASHRARLGLEALEDRLVPSSLGVPVTWGTTPPAVPAGLSNVVAVAAGHYHSLALKSDGTVVAWGTDNRGDTAVPAGLSNVVAVAEGDGFSLALKSDGTVTAWGNPFNNGSAVPTGLSNVVAISAGSTHSLALKSDGTVVPWGFDFQNDMDVPAGLSNVVAIAAGGVHSLALKSDGTVVPWGDSSNGVTAMPAGLSNVVAVAAGDVHSLALKSDGTVVAWGDDRDGDTAVPTGLSNVVAISAGYNFSLALRSDGTVVAWGNPSQGVPAGLSNVDAVAAGTGFSVALPQDGDVLTAASGDRQSAPVGNALAAPLRVKVVDAFGRAAPNVLVAFAAPTTGAGGTFAGGSSRALVLTDANGFATAPAFAANGTAGSFQITASAGAATATFDLTSTPRLPNQLAVLSAPASITAGQTFSMQVAVEDNFGNVVTSDSSTVTISLSGVSGGGFTSGTTAIAAVNGVATFSNLTIQRAGSYTLGAHASGRLDDASPALTVNPSAPAFLAATAGMPQSVAVGNDYAALSAQVTDQYGNPIPGASVTFAAPEGASFAGGGNDTETTNASGVATTTRTLTASHTPGAFTVTAAAGALSASFSLSSTPGQPNKLVLVNAPASLTAGQTLGFQVDVEDSFGNVVTSDSSTVTISASGVSGGFTSGTTSVSAVNGIATFSNLAVQRAGSYTLGAADGADGLSTGAGLTVSPSAPAFLSATSGTPQSVAVGTAFAALSAQVTDLYGNPIAGVSVTFAAPVGASFAGGGSDVETTGADGVATTTKALTAGTTPAAFTLGASAGALSAGFALSSVPGQPAQLAFLTAPTAAAPGQPFSVQVAVEDSYGNVVTADGSTVTLTPNGPGAFTGGHASVQAQGGIATFTGLVLEQLGGYSLTASDGGLSPAVSPRFPLTFTDGFTQASNTGLSPAWTIQEGNFNVFNQAAVGTGPVDLATVNTVLPLADAVVSADVQLGAVGQEAGLVVHYGGPGDQNDYEGLLSDTSSGFVASLVRDVNGVQTVLASASVGSGSGTLELDVSGPSLRLLFNDSVVASAEDVSLGAGGLGLRAIAGATLDNFTAAAALAFSPAPGDLTLSHTQGPYSDTITVSNPGNAAPSYSGPVIVTAAAVVQQRLALVALMPDGGYATGDTIAGARWLQSTNGSNGGKIGRGQYYLLPSGELHFWDGSASDTGSSTLVAALVPAYYQDPQLLLHAQAPALPAGVSAGYTATSNGGATLQIAGFAGFAGAFGVQLGISDGAQSFTTSFLVTVTDSAPTLALTGLTPPSTLTQIPAATTAHTSGGVAGTFTSGDADGDALANSARVVSQAYAVEEALALDAIYTGGSYDLNDTITGARWFVSGNGSNSGFGGQYYLLPDGTLHFWDGNASHTGASTLVAALGAVVYGDPTLLLTAPLAQAAYSAEQSLALTSLLPGNNFDTGDTIPGAQWFRSTNGGNAANGGSISCCPTARCTPGTASPRGCPAARPSRATAARRWRRCRRSTTTSRCCWSTPSRRCLCPPA
jgi:S-adenosylmethionine hydrolase